MGDELLPYYDRELAFLRDLGKEFAQANPKIATRLQIGPDSINDPLLERTIRAVAYLNARTRYKLDDEFPELTDALLGVLYPHYLAPIPAMAIVQFQLEPTITAGKTLLRGDTELETEPIDGEPCRFRTCYDVDLWPIEVESARLMARPFPISTNGNSEEAESLLHLALKCTAPELRFEQVAPKKLRFFLQGQEQHIYPLYELILNNLVEVGIRGSGNNQNPNNLSLSAVRPVGFGVNEGLLPYPPHSFMGYRLLSEYFSFPLKYLFFDLVFEDSENQPLTQASREAWALADDKLDVYFFIRDKNPDLEDVITADHFVLGCTPIVNLFEQRAEPIALTHTQSEYEIVPDRRRRQSMEIYSVNDVSASDDSGKSVQYFPFYGINHTRQDTDLRRFWHSARRPARYFDGSEVFLNLVDLDFNPSATADQKLSIRTTCFNRNQPNRLPFGGGQPKLQLREGDTPLNAINCLTKPTQTARPPLGREGIWNLVSHLSLNYLSIIGDGHTEQQNEGAKALREILMLYDFQDSEITRGMINGIAKVTSRRVSRRLRQGAQVGICRGTEVTLYIDETRFPSKEWFLLASVLERFLALYCSINSFTQLKAVNHPAEKVLSLWPPRAGEQTLV